MVLGLNYFNFYFYYFNSLLFYYFLILTILIFYTRKDLEKHVVSENIVIYS